MVAAAQVAVGPLDEVDREARQVTLASFLQVAAELVRRQVGGAAGAGLGLQTLAHFFIGRRVIGRDAGTGRAQRQPQQRREAIGKQTQLARIALAEVAHRAADDVVRDHRFDAQTFAPRLRRPAGGAEQALLFAGEGDEHQRGVEAAAGHHAGHLHHGGHTGGVVVGAGCVGLGVQHVAGHRVVVPADDVEAVARQRVGAGQRRDHIDDRRGLRYARADGFEVFLKGDLQTPAGSA